MDEVTLTAERGRALGSRPSGRLRAEGKVPAIVYGHGLEPVKVAVSRRELRAALTTESGVNALINLKVDGDSHLTIVRDIQRDPVRHGVLHVDFVVVRRDEVIHVDVPIVLEGEAIEVKREQGLVEQLLSSLAITAKPGDIPANFTVDISGLKIGDAVRVGDLQFPPGVATELDPEEPIVIAQLSRAAMEVEKVEEEAALEALAEAGVSEEDREALEAVAEAEAVEEGAGEEEAAAAPEGGGEEQA
jgi:large subunit ribosomal protein L25